MTFFAKLWRALASWAGQAPVVRANRVARIISDPFDELGFGPGWANSRHGEYFATSTAVHAAVRVRAEAVARPPLRVLRRSVSGIREPAGWDDPLQALLERPNPFWSGGELLRATESHLLLWGSAFWGIERDPSTETLELWPLRPDRMRVQPDSDRYVRGFIYEHAGARIPYLPDEVVWFRHLNPLDEFGGVSAVAPARLALEMGADALRFNRNFFRNSATPGDVVLTTDETLVEEDVQLFYKRWADRFEGGGNAHKPLLLVRGMDVRRLGLSQRDMEFISGLRWTVEEVSRAFGVPKALLGDLEDATLANVRTEEQFLWRNTIVPELRLLAESINRSLAPLFGGPGEYEVEFDISAIEALKDNENDRVDRLVKLVQAGVLTINEVRAGQGLAAVEWGDVRA